MNDLFTRPPFDINAEIIERNKQLMEKHPESAAELQAQIERVESGKTDFNPLRAKYDAASPADQLRMMGVKSAPKQQVLTPEQDKAKRASRFAEDNIVNAWAKWFKMQYKGVPYTIDKVAQQRSKMRGMLDKAASFQRGNPDIFIQSAKAGFHGMYIEQKRDDDIFYAGTRILKPGANNQHVWQSLYHAMLRDQGYWVMFSISLEASVKMSTRYMEGNAFKQVVFDYYCKPEDYPIFADNKYFKPVKERP